MSAREAWQLCGEPNGEAGIQNIRKRARLLVASKADAAGSVESPALEVPGAGEEPAPPPPSSSRKKSLFRLRPDQVAKMAAERAKHKALYHRLYIQATTEVNHRSILIALLFATCCALGSVHACAIAMPRQNLVPV